VHVLQIGCGKRLTGSAAAQHEQRGVADLRAPGLLGRDALAQVERAAQAPPVVRLQMR
jgi:hypothetical protein